METGQLSVSAIDASQGGEADVVIYLTARSNGSYGWGFRDAPNRTDVALTRAKRFVVLIGDRRMFEAATESALRTLTKYG
eukprot:9447647-Pyramimonas_sp.AAC.1